MVTLFAGRVVMIVVRIRFRKQAFPEIDAKLFEKGYRVLGHRLRRMLMFVRPVRMAFVVMIVLVGVRFTNRRISFLMLRCGFPLK